MTLDGEELSGLMDNFPLIKEMLKIGVMTSRGMNRSLKPDKDACDRRMNKSKWYLNGNLLSSRKDLENF